MGGLKMKIPTLYKGKDKRSGQWRIGYYYDNCGMKFISAYKGPLNDTYGVDENTVGMFTGFFVEGKYFKERVFTGDVLGFEGLDGNEVTGTVVFNKGAFWFRMDGTEEDCDTLLYEVLENHKCVVKGNVWDKTEN